MNFPNKTNLGTKTLFVLMSILMTAVLVNAQKEPTPEAASVDQCHNGAISGPVQPCAYVNGNSHGGNSQWYENQFISYRVVNSDFAAGTIGATMLIQYDTTVSSGKHAIDYLGWYNYTQTNGLIPGTTTADATNYPNEGNNPCLPLASCPGAPDFDAFPLDPNVAAGPNGIPGDGDDITQIPGGLTTWGCTVTSISAPVLYNGSYASASATQHTVTFNVGAGGTCYFAWGGHIASRLDWGANNSAVAISGSPYHMRINGGADRQLKVEPQGFPAKLTIIKRVATYLQPNDTDDCSSQFFVFTRTSAPNFSLQDLIGTNASCTGAPGSDRVTFDYPLAAGQTASATITELATGGGWGITDIACVDSTGGLGFTANSSPQPGAWSSNPTNFAVANMQEAEFVTCTFDNQQAAPTAAPVTLSGRVTNSFGRGLAGVVLTLTDLETGSYRMVTTNTFGYYTFTDVTVETFYQLTATSKRYTFADDTRYFTLNEDTFGMNFVANP